MIYTIVPLLLMSACYSPPRNQSLKKESVIHASFVVVQEAVLEVMSEKGILVKTKETPATITVSGNILVNVEQYADCGRYYGKRLNGYADMNFVILVQKVDKNRCGIQITSTITITEPDSMVLKERKLPCISNGRMEEELLGATMQKLSKKR